MWANSGDNSCEKGAATEWLWEPVACSPTELSNLALNQRAAAPQRLHLSSLTLTERRALPRSQSQLARSIDTKVTLRCQTSFRGSDHYFLIKRLMLDKVITSTFKQLHSWLCWMESAHFLPGTSPYLSVIVADAQSLLKHMKEGRGSYVSFTLTHSRALTPTRTQFRKPGVFDDPSIPLFHSEDDAASVLLACYVPRGVIEIKSQPETRFLFGVACRGLCGSEGWWKSRTEDQQRFRAGVYPALWGFSAAMEAGTQQD